MHPRPTIHDRLSQIVLHLAAAAGESIASDDQIIIGHVRDALRLATELRDELAGKES